MVSAQTPAMKKASVSMRPAAAAASGKNYKLTGSPTAPVTIELYTDYSCPACRALYMQVLPKIETEYVATGKVQVLHRDFPLPIAAHQYSKLAARFANAAGQLGQTQYLLVSKQLFETQPEWTQNGNIDAQVAKVLSQAEMQKVREMVKSDTHLDDTVTADVAMGNRDGLNETPTMIFVTKGKRQKVSGQLPVKVLESYLDQLLAKS